MDNQLTPAALRVSEHIRQLPQTATFGGGAPVKGIRYSLKGGSPAPEALPIDAIAQASARVLASPLAPKVALNYSDAHGNLLLREWLAAREGVAPNRIVITNGALHGISLAARALLDPGDAVVLEDPSFVVAIKALQYARADLVKISLEGGAFLDRLRTQLANGLRPRIVYVIADFQNPTGGVLSAEDRRELVALAERFGFVVFWDNPYRDSRLSGAVVEDVRIDSAHVVKINTFSKSLGPGLRLGWLVLPDVLVEPVLNIRRRTDQQSPTLMQAIVAEIVSGPGRFDAIVSAIGDLHRARLDALVAGLETHLDGILAFSKPEGGFFVWTKLRDDTIAPLELERAALAEGIEYVSGRQFGETLPSDYSRYLRLGFTTLAPDRLSESIVALRRAVERTRTGR